MWSPDRRHLIAAAGALLALGGCGFTPAYAPGGSGEQLRGHLRPDPPRSDTDFAFVTQLETLLGSTPDAPYGLSYNIRMRSQGLAVTSDQETLRYHLIGHVNWKVIDRSTDTVLASGRTESFTAYSAIGTTVATRASERDAMRRLMVILADDLVAQLIATGESWLP